MESILTISLGHFFSLASNLHSDAILTAQKNKFLKELETDEKARDALRVYRPVVEHIRLACIKLADMHEQLWRSPTQKRLMPLLTDARFHSDFVEWLQAGDIEEGEAVRDRILKKIQSLLGTSVSEEQLAFLQSGFFEALNNVVFADTILSRWRFDLSIRYLREQVAVLRRLAEKNAGIYSESEQRRALDNYCQKVLKTWDIIDLSNLPEGDKHLATQTLLLRQLYMPLRISFSKASLDSQDDTQLKRIEDMREMRRLAEAGRRDEFNPGKTGGMEAPISVGERLFTSQRLVVLGDPGGGKTTMMRWMATVYLLRYIGDPAVELIPDVDSLPLQPLIPVLIRCRDIGAEDLCRSFGDVLRIHLSKTTEDASIMGAIILERIAKGEILLLVDGLDEILNSNNRMMFCEELERMAARYPQATIIVTSRIVGYRDMPYRMRTGFDHGVISDLHAKDKEHFAERWVEVTEPHQTEEERAKSTLELIEALRSTDRIKRLTGNPMMLTTMALVKRQVGKLPSKRNKLYALAVSVLLNWNDRIYGRIDGDEALPQLEYLAYEMCRLGVQQLSGKEILGLLHQIRRDFPDAWPIHDHSPKEFLNKIEARSGLLMRSGDIWQPNQRQEKDVWEFRHLTFQEYLAARALIDDYYPSSQDIEQSLSNQVARLATPRQDNHHDRDRLTKQDAAVPDSWREALRLLVADCRYKEVNGVLLSILHPTPEEDATLSQRPRAILAAQCLADEPYVSKETAKEVIDRFVSTIGKNEGVGMIGTVVERAALEVWSSIWKDMLQASLIKAFCEGRLIFRANCGGVLAQLLGVTPAATVESPEEGLELLLASLAAVDRDEAVCAALKVVQLAHQGSMSCSDALIESLLSLLGREGSGGHAAAWALAWLSVKVPTDLAERRSIFQNRLVPPVLATVWDGVEGWGWRPNEEQVGALLAALGRAEAREGAGQCHLIRLLGKSAQPNVVLPILGCVADPDAAIREAAREALAWLANHLPAGLSPAQLDALEEQVGAGLVRNDSLAEAERCDGLVVVALFGQERLLREVLADQGAPVALRRQAAEGLGLVAYRCGNADQRQRLRDELEGLMRGNALDLLVTGAEGWAEHDQCLPFLQGASRGLQMAATADLPLLGSASPKRVPMLNLTALEEGEEGEGLRIRTEVVTPAVWRLPLPQWPGEAAQQLELVVVHGGDYVIGSPEEEEGRDFYKHFREKCEGVNVEAQRKVSLKAFTLVRHPLTQAQWRAVATLPRQKSDLNPTPGTYKPDGLWESHAQPGGLAVDSVSWHHCQEWLKRLNRWLSEQWLALGGQGEAPVFGLPSESQWEVACRAGSGTPFHFGDTLDVSWANYHGCYTYGNGRKGIYRQRPVPVGAFGLVNRWGLAELHGQLWEWCGDQWHRDSVEGAAGDGSALEGPDLELEGNQEQAMRLLRGGSWVYDPCFTRAAMRGGNHPGDLDSSVGVRPGCFSPPGLFLYT